MILDLPVRARGGDGVLVALDQIREELLLIRVGDVRAVLIFRTVAADVEIGGIGRIEAEIDLVARLRLCQLRIGELSLRFINLVEGEQRGRLGHARAAAAGVVRTFDGRVVLQPLDHRAQLRAIRLQHAVQIVFDGERARLGRGQLLAAGGDDGGIAVSLLLGKLTELIVGHRVIAALQGVRGGLEAVVERAEIRRELAHQGAEARQICGIDAVCVGLQLLDGDDGAHLCASRDGGRLGGLDGVERSFVRGL